MHHLCIVVIFVQLFRPQKASAAQSEGGKRRGRPKKEVRVSSAESMLPFV